MSICFVRLTRSLISLVNDNHVDNYLKEIIAFVYYGSNVNNRPRSVDSTLMCWTFGRSSQCEDKQLHVIHAKVVSLGDVSLKTINLY